jgi:DNA primase
VGHQKPTGFTPVLYQHADVLRAIATDQPVWIVEGEKDADNAAARGLVATTNAQGSGSFPRELADVFTGATVNVVADRDSAGYKRAAQLHHMLGEVGATVTLYRPAVDVDKGVSPTTSRRAWASRTWRRSRSATPCCSS